MAPSAEYRDFIGMAAMLIFAICFSAAAILLPWILGPRRTHGPLKDSPYECGLPPLTNRFRFGVKFYVVAMLFILFDIEVVFLIGWAAIYRHLVRPAAEGGIGWTAFFGAFVFLLILEAGHLYAWKKGALDWAPLRNRKRVP